MDKFDGIRMQSLVRVRDPDSDGGLTLVFENGRMMKIRVLDGKITSEIL